MSDSKPYFSHSIDNYIRRNISPFSNIAYSSQDDDITKTALTHVTSFSGILFLESFFYGPTTVPLQTEAAARDVLQIIKQAFDTGVHTKGGDVRHGMSLEKLNTALNAIEGKFPQLTDDINAFRDYAYTDPDVIEGMVARHDTYVLREHVGRYENCLLYTSPSPRDS